MGRPRARPEGRALRNFDLALRPDLAVAILVKGMEQGAFTGLALADCITGTGTTPSS
jgi:hypothetical protein